MDQGALEITDDYTGHIENQQIAQRRTTPVATIIKMSVGPMDNNAYLVTCTATGASMLIDAANEADRLQELLTAAGAKPDLIFTTHRHPDHWFALADVKAATGAPTWAGRHDDEGIPVDSDHLVDDGEVISVGDLRLTAIHLKGHTPGSIALALDDGTRTHIFTGDSLFPGGVGKTQSPEDFASLIDDVSTKLFDRFGDDTAIYPGHGDDTTLGAERPDLPEWRERGW
jgi:glyoxylase-like metal-dependent hydrolase (beta-lactamase superfamily II)